MPQRQDRHVQEDILRARAQSLREMRNHIDAVLRDVSDKLAEFGQQPMGVPQTGASGVDNDQEGRGERGSHGRTPRQRPLRDVMVDALEDLGCLVHSRDLALYCKARYGRPITAERFGSLSRDEMDTYRKGTTNRPVWLCFGLTYNRHEAIRRLWGRSDWPIEERVVAPTTGRILQLTLTKRLCEIALEADAYAEGAESAEMLHTLAASHAGDLPDVKVRYGEFDLVGWRDKAAEQLEKDSPRDREARLEAARQIARRGEIFQLFGVPEIFEGTSDVPLGAVRETGR